MSFLVGQPGIDKGIRNSKSQAAKAMAKLSHSCAGAAVSPS